MMGYFATKVGVPLNSVTAAARTMASESYDLQNNLAPLIDNFEAATQEAQDLLLETVRVGGLENLKKAPPLQKYQRAFLLLENALEKVRENNPRLAPQAATALEAMEGVYQALLPEQIKESVTAGSNFGLAGPGIR